MNPRNRKLNEEQVKEIYAKRGTLTQKARAALYNVSDGVIAQIDTGRAWARVTGHPKPSSRPPERRYYDD